jgi:hypothetical protein
MDPLPTHAEILEAYHTATFRDAMELSERTGMPPEECVLYVQPFQAHIASIALNLLALSQSDKPLEG